MIPFVVYVDQKTIAFTVLKESFNTILLLYFETSYF